MKFVAVSDTHGCHRELKLPKGDVFIHAGDVCDRGNRQQAADFFTWVAEIEFAHKVLIWGNHDFDLATDELLFPDELPDDLVVLDHCQHQIGDIKIWGTPTPANKRGERWEQIPAGVDIVITHRPPQGILDVARVRGSQGSRSLAARIQEISPRVHVFGHIHHSHGVEVRGQTKFINASQYRSSKRRLEYQPILFEL